MPKHPNKSSTLLYHGNLSPETVEKMKISRTLCVYLAQHIESLGESRELSLAFTSLEHAQMLLIKHLCMVDPQATLENPYLQPIMKYPCTGSLTEAAADAARTLSESVIADATGCD